tara:strand:- start:49 stop:642 length:594 start_codon:yes stop_codon:yes gene_type:complete
MKIIITENQLSKLILVETEKEWVDKVKEYKNEVSEISKRVDKIGLGSSVATFLNRISATESCYGLNKSNGKNNIYQIDKTAFDDTQKTKSHPGLVDKFKKIEDKTKIIWSAQTYSDIRNNKFKNGIAARLLLSNKPGKIPTDLKGQSNYWKKYYNSSKGGGSTQDFIDKNEGEGIEHCKFYGKNEVDRIVNSKVKTP